jgi:hypothetical protein
MELVSDSSIAVKIRKMQKRVRWQEKVIVERGIDQTRFVFEDSWPDSPEFSFLVVGDSGLGSAYGQSPQRRIAEQMLVHGDTCRFVLHTGDVIYLSSNGVCPNSRNLPANPCSISSPLSGK